MSTESTTSEKKIGLTLLTGFLGAGKTTLLNNILKSETAQKSKIAVIENEFILEVGIENELVLKPRGEEDPELFNEIYEFGGGCICCSANGEFEKTVDRLLAKKATLDHIVVETTGLAVPEPVTRVLTRDPYFMEHLYINSVVTVVDAKHFLSQLTDERKTNNKNVKNEAWEQVIAADKIIVNKIDLVDEQELEKVVSAIRNINSFAEIIKTQHSVVDVAQLLNSKSFKQGQIDTSAINNAATHHPDVSSLFIAHEQPLSLSVVHAWINDIIAHKQLLRMKGLIRVADTDVVYLLQGVGAIYDIHPIDKSWLDEPSQSRMSKFVFFGWNLDKEAMQQQLQTLAASTK